MRVTAPEVKAKRLVVLKELWASASLAEISERLGLRPKTVNRLAKRAGLPRREYAPMEMAGRQFSRLTVLSHAGAGDWLCRCACGETRIIGGTNLRQGKAQSCGCWRADVSRALHTTHGGTDTREWRAWRNMISRCYRVTTNNYHTYGGRGITVCDEWRSDFAAFCRDLGPCPEGMSLDRIDVNGPYAPGNCRWASKAIQMRNTTRNRMLTYQGETLCLRDWAARAGKWEGVVANRLKRGWSVEEALGFAARSSRASA